MAGFKSRRTCVALSFTAAAAISAHASADEMVKIGISAALSGSGAVWGKGMDWMCRKAAQEIKDTGGVAIKGVTYNFECITYDNKYSAAEATKVAQTLLNRDQVKYIHVLGTAPVLATQALTERQGAMLFMNSWGLSSKGPKFPLSFSAVNSPIEIMPVMVQYMKKTYPGARTIALLNANDASGRESASISGPLWERAGFKVVSSDFYERGTTEFQPIASRLVAQKVDVIDLASVAPADAGLLFKELDVRGFKGVKISDTGTGVDGTVTTGGAAANGVYMAAALALDGPSATEHQRKLNEQARAAIGMGLATPHIGAYDTVYMIKAGMEKAQSIDPKKVAAALPSVSFSTFYGGQVGFGEKDIYGSVQQPILPVFITQIEDGKVVLKSRIDR